MRAFLAAACAVAVLSGGAPARAAVAYDPDHTSAHFAVKHLTISTVEGSIPLKSVTVVVGPQDVLRSVDATLDLAGIDTENHERDADLRSPHWFDVARDPTMTFQSTSITGDAADMTVFGDLTFHGESHTVTLIAKYEGEMKDMRGRTHLGYSATGTLDRTQWGLGPSFPPAIVGHEITLTLALEVIVT